jgi:arginine/serine-rich splicing factor 7
MQQQQPEYYKVYIGNVPKNARESDIKEFFLSYGNIYNIVLKRSYGFVEFEDRGDADDAVKHLDGKMLLGARLIIEHVGSSRVVVENLYWRTS